MTLQTIRNISDQCKKNMKDKKQIPKFEIKLNYSISSHFLCILILLIISLQQWFFFTLSLKGPQCLYYEWHVAPLTCISRKQFCVFIFGRLFLLGRLSPLGCVPWRLLCVHLYSGRSTHCAPLNILIFGFLKKWFFFTPYGNG